MALVMHTPDHAHAHTDHTLTDSLSYSSSTIRMAFCTSSFSTDTDFAPLMNLCWLRAVADGRSSGFFTRHARMKSEKSLEKDLGSLRVGGGLVGIMKIAWW